ncbi:TPA: hypothetical protein DDZ86_04210 [Candidatus Dependentiae bacterium]|nr:MAG: YbaK/prolyl-tRNA synthetase associated region [candidate division TM6 bacterium GW2011_GWF2_43_87]HBL98818.1 hypothetical protein [Candidatus Dependentiae bacterium]
MNEEILFDFLNTHQIDYKLFKHLPVFTTKDKLVLIDSNDVDTIPGLHSKNLFLKTEKQGTFFLVSVTDEKRVDLKALSKILETSRFSFGKPEELLELLKLKPGSVTPFGLLFDSENHVTFILDEDFLMGTHVNFHPLRNDGTLCLTPQAFLACMGKMGHPPHVTQIPVKID